MAPVLPISLSSATVHNHHAVRPGAQERLLAHVPDGAGTLLSVLHPVERVGAGGLRGAAAVAHVPLSARPDQCVSEADAPARLYHIAAK